MNKRRILIIHQNFPGQFRRIAAHLAERDDVEVLGIGRDTAPGLEGVRWIKYTLHRNVAEQTHHYCRKLESAVLHGQAVIKVLQKLKAQGYTPDTILAHPGWGETLYAREIFPQARLIHLCEWYYQTQGADLGFDPEFPDTLDNRLRVTTWNAQHLLSLEQCDQAISPTQWQKSQYPQAYQDKIQVIHEGIDTDLLTPDANAVLTLPNGQQLKAGQPLITYVARNLEPYRGFHSFMRALEKIQQQHKTCQTVIVGGDDVSYGGRPKDHPNWREKMLAEVSIDTSRTHFLGRVPYDTYRKVLQISAAHVYLTYPFVLSWSMLEAMASGCLVIGSNTAPVKEVIQPGKNGLLVDFFDADAIARQLIEVLDKPDRFAAARKEARKRVQRHYSLQSGLEQYLELLDLSGQTQQRRVA